METKLRIVYDTISHNRNFIQGYEFDVFFKSESNEWIVTESGEVYNFENDACIEIESDGILNRKSMMDRAEEVEADNISDYIKASQEAGMYVNPGQPNYANKITEKQLEQIRREDQRENG